MLLCGGVSGYAICKFVYPFVHAASQIMFGKAFVYSNIALEPGAILKNEIGFFNINFFKDINEAGDGTTDSMIVTLRTVVSQVYVTMRDICLVAMLIVMIYIAIRGLLALNPKEKSRYKENFVNCLVGVILIVSAHFIMSISVTLVDMISESIITSTGDVQLDTSVGNAENMSKSELQKIADEKVKEDPDSVQTIKRCFYNSIRREDL